MQDSDRPSRVRRAVWATVLLCAFAAVSGFGALQAVGAGGPPTPVINSVGLPANPTDETSARFMFTDAQSVTFECARNEAAYSHCGANFFGSKSYPGPLSAGSHTFRVRAVKGGRTSSAAVYTWTILTSPRSVSTPRLGPSPTKAPAAHGGQHQLEVRTIDEAGDLSSPATYWWKLRQANRAPIRRGPSGASPSGASPEDGAPADEAPADEAPFEVTGNVGGLAPGVTKVIAITLENPNPVPIYVTSLTVGISADSSPSGCPSAVNIVLHQATGITSGSPVTVPANGSVTVNTYPRAPKIGLRDLPTNQEKCKGASFTLTYTGSAH